MKVTEYEIRTDKSGIDMRFAVVSDLHARSYKKIIDALKSISPDAILLPGDIVEIAAEYMDKRNQNGLRFLEEAVHIAPCYYCYGNHEIYYSHAKWGRTGRPQPDLSREYMERILTCGVHVINDSCETFKVGSYKGEISIGGLVCGWDTDPKFESKGIDRDFLKKFDETDNFKLLLCHYPHYYEEYLKETGVDLVLSGHAHGGQWRLFGRGVYAPHQGLFPKYTSGIHDGRHIISRGASNNVKPIPRIFNAPEILDLRIISK